MQQKWLAISTMHLIKGHVQVVLKALVSSSSSNLCSDVLLSTYMDDPLITAGLASRKLCVILRKCLVKGPKINTVILVITIWHNWVKKMIHWELCKRLKFGHTNK